MMNRSGRILTLSFVLSLVLACSGVQPGDRLVTDEARPASRIIPRTDRTSVSSRLNPPSEGAKASSKEKKPSIRKQKATRPDTSPKESSHASDGFPDGYTKWKKLSNAPIYRDGAEEVWSMFMGPETRIENNVFVAGSVLVKEIRSAKRKGSQITGGKPLVIAVMHKTAKGTWRMAAYEPDTHKPADNVDTDGCMLCHQSRNETDFSFRAFARLGPKTAGSTTTSSDGKETPTVAKEPIREDPTDYIGMNPTDGVLVHPSEEAMPAIQRALRRARCPKRTEFSGTTIEPLVPANQVLLGSFSGSNKDEALVRVFDCMGPQDDTNPNVDAYEVLVHLKKRRNRWSSHAIHKVSAITGWYRFLSNSQQHRIVIRSDRNTTGTASFGASSESHEAKFGILTFKRRTVREEPLFTLTYLESGLCNETIQTRWESKRIDIDDVLDLSAIVTLKTCSPGEEKSFDVVFVNRGGSFLPNRKTLESIDAAR